MKERRRRVIGPFMWLLCLIGWTIGFAASSWFLGIGR